MVLVLCQTHINLSIIYPRSLFHLLSIPVLIYQPHSVVNEVCYHSLTQHTCHSWYVVCVQMTEMITRSVNKQCLLDTHPTPTPPYTTPQT